MKLLFWHVGWRQRKTFLWNSVLLWSAMQAYIIMFWKNFSSHHLLHFLIIMGWVPNYYGFHSKALFVSTLCTSQQLAFTIFCHLCQDYCHQFIQLWVFKYTFKWHFIIILCMRIPLEHHKRLLSGLLSRVYAC